MHDLISRLDGKRALSPVAATTDNTAYVSEILDLQGCRGAALFINIGSLADVDATFTVLIEEGDVANMSDHAAVDDSDLNGTEALAGFTFAADNSIRKIGYRGGKRYLRATITPASNTGNVFITAIWIVDRNLLPTSNPPT